MTFKDTNQAQQFQNSQVYREFCQLLPAVSKLIDFERFDDSLSMIEDFYLKNCSSIHAGEIRLKCDIWVSLIFEKAGRFSESLVISTRLRKNTHPTNGNFLSFTTDIIRLLVEMDRHEDVIPEVEETLSVIKSEDNFDLLFILFYYAQALQTCTKDMPVTYFDLVLKVVNEMCPELLDASLISSDYLIELILDIYEAHSLANKRYADLMITLVKFSESSQDISNEILLIKNYIEEEKFTYYRQMAVEELQDLEEYIESQNELEPN